MLCGTFFLGNILAGQTNQSSPVIYDSFSTDTRSNYTNIVEPGTNTYLPNEFLYLPSDHMVSLRMDCTNSTSAVVYPARNRVTELTPFQVALGYPTTLTLTFGASANVPTASGTETVTAALPLVVTGTLGFAQVRLGIVPGKALDMDTANVGSLFVTACSTNSAVTLELRSGNQTLASGTITLNGGWSSGDKIILAISDYTAEVDYYIANSKTTTPVLVDVTHNLNRVLYTNGAYASFDVGNSGGVPSGAEFNDRLVVQSLEVDSAGLMPPTVSSTGTTSALVTWPAVAGATGYNIYRINSTNAPSNTPPLASVPATNAPGSPVTYSDSGPLSEYQSYGYSISATNSTGTLGNSTTSVFGYSRFPFVMPWNGVDSIPSTNINTTVTDMSTNSPWATTGSLSQISVQNGHLYANGAPIKLFGVNVSDQGCFPPKNDPVNGDIAKATADRLEKLGVNAVRFSRLELPSFAGGALGASPYTTLDTTQIGYFDHFVSCLEQDGIYIVIQLKPIFAGTTTSGTTTSGTPSFILAPGADLYNPSMLTDQETMASLLLSHVNQETGRPYAQDPGLAMVEINNEDGLMNNWYKGLFDMPMFTSYTNTLQLLWNSWLVNKYRTTGTLSTAWAPSSGNLYYGKALLTNGNFTNGFVLPWGLYVKSNTATATSAVSTTDTSPGGGSSLEINVTQSSATNSDIQLCQNQLSVTSGQLYTVSFWAKAVTSQPTTISVGLIQDASPWSELTPWAHFTLGSTWQQYTFCPTVNSSCSDARLQIIGLSTQTGTVSFSDFNVLTGNTILGPASSVAEGEGALKSEMIINGDFDSAFSQPWNFYVPDKTNSSAIGTATIATGSTNSLTINVTQASSTDSDIQLYQGSLNLTNGQPYTISFSASATPARTLSVSLRNNAFPYGYLTPVNYLPLTDSGQTFTYCVVPTANCTNARIHFSGFAAATGTVSLSNISVRPGTPGYGLPAGEGLSSGTLTPNPVSLLDVKTASLQSHARQLDWMHFLCDTETSYWETMSKYLRTTVGTKALIVGTQSENSPSLVQANLDVIDTHNYWQQPSFTGPIFNPTNWAMQCSSMAGDLYGGTLSSRGAMRVAGKPMICTEYNHPAPNPHGSEAFLLASAYARLQDWDGLFVSGYLQSREWTNGYFDSWYEISHDPAKLVTLPAAASIMRGMDVSAGTNQVVATVSPGDMIESLTDGNMPFESAAFGIDPMLTFQQPLGIQTGTMTEVTAPAPVAGTSPILSQTGELSWDTANHVVTIKAANVKALIGQTVPGQNYDLGSGVGVSLGTTMQANNYAVVSLLDKTNGGFTSGSDVLVTATGYTDNFLMQWSPGMDPTASLSTVSSNWGQEPSLVEGITGTITLPVPASKVSVWGLDETGQRETSIPVSANGASASFSIGLTYQTPWYEVQISK